MNTVHFFICGHVQGVGFRHFVIRQAELYGLSGFVRNTNDGKVEVYATGTSESLTPFIQACQKGPIFASVDTLYFDDNDNKKPLPKQQGQKDFFILG